MSRKLGREILKGESEKWKRKSYDEVAVFKPDHQELYELEIDGIVYEISALWLDNNGDFVQISLAVTGPRLPTIWICSRGIIFYSDGRVDA